MHMSRRAKGALLDGGRSARPGLWEVCGGQVRALGKDGSSPFLEFRFSCLALTGSHPPHDHTHQEYG